MQNETKMTKELYPKTLIYLRQYKPIVGCISWVLHLVLHGIEEQDRHNFCT